MKIIQDSFKKYIHSVLFPPDNTPSPTVDDDEVEQIPITLRLKKDVAQVDRLIAKHYDNEDFNTFVSEEVSKIIFSIAESSSTILEPPQMSNELKRKVQKLLLLLLEQEKEKNNKGKIKDDDLSR